MLKNIISITIILTLISLTGTANSKGWIKLEPPGITSSTVRKLSPVIKKELKSHSTGLLKYKNILRVEILGDSEHSGLSETVLYFKKAPSKAFAVAKSNIAKRSSVMISQYSICPWDEVKLRHNCPGGGIANEGPIDIMNLVKKNKLLVISRSRKGNPTKTVLWMASNDIPQIYYFGISQNHFGKDSLSITHYTLSPEPSPALPPDPDEILLKNKNPKNPSESDGTKTKPETKNLPVKTPPVIVKPMQEDSKKTPIVPTGFNTISMKKLISPVNRMKKDFLPKIDDMQKLNWHRLQVTSIDYLSGSDFKLHFSGKIEKLFIYSWTDNRNLKNTSVGDTSKCTRKGLNGCPFVIDGTRWYDFSNLIKTSTMEVRSFPGVAYGGNLIIWVGTYDSSISFSYKSENFTGSIASASYLSDRTVSDVTSAANKTSKLPKTAKKPFIHANISEISKLLNADGIDASESGLLGYKYLLKITLKPGKKYPALVDLVLPSVPDFVLGKSTGNQRGKFRTQLGSRRKCSSLSCPYHIHNLGWRNLTAGFSSVKSRIVIKSPTEGAVSKVQFWIGYSTTPDNWKIAVSGKKAIRPNISTSVYKLISTSH
ncbi:MAG: hypothetical protein JXR95_13720 [Deltaproteobacteria bacterium]|nr:hypothetical protein [Deltaproteobacteria bacterium]